MRISLFFFLALVFIQLNAQVVLQDEADYLEDPMLEAHKITLGLGLGAEFGLTYGARLTYAIPIGLEVLLGGGRVSTGEGLFTNGHQTWTAGLKYKLPFFRYHPHTSHYVVILHGHNGYDQFDDFLNRNTSIGLGIDLGVFHPRLYCTVGLYYIFHDRDEAFKRRIFPSLGLSYVLKKIE